MENPIYKDADQILVIMKETFGLDGYDLKQLVRTELIQRTLNLVKQQQEAKKMMAASTLNFGVDMDDSIKSIDQPLIQN